MQCQTSESRNLARESTRYDEKRENAQGAV